MNEEEPRPKIVHRCRMCKVSEEDVESNRVIVSPMGTAHHGDEGMTACGRDATGLLWWWPL